LAAGPGAAGLRLTESFMADECAFSKFLRTFVGLACEGFVGRRDGISVSEPGLRLGNISIGVDELRMPCIPGYQSINAAFSPSTDRR